MIVYIYKWMLRHAFDLNYSRIFLLGCRWLQLFSLDDLPGFKVVYARRNNDWYGRAIVYQNGTYEFVRNKKYTPSVKEQELIQQYGINNVFMPIELVE